MKTIKNIKVDRVINLEAVDQILHLTNKISKEMTTECPYCGMDNAYCDGVEYVCPDCGHTWPCDEIPNDDEWDEDDDGCNFSASYFL